MAFWWRPRYGVSGPLAVMVLALSFLPHTAYPASHAAANSGFVYWRDVVTGFAIGGYDPVAYFVDARPRLGTGKYEYDWQGVTWRFVSAANRAVFVRDPTVYAPKYGGYSAQSMVLGLLARGSPVDWLIFDDRLYFFSDASQRGNWLEQSIIHRRAANKNWPKINQALVRF